MKKLKEKSTKEFLIKEYINLRKTMFVIGCKNSCNKETIRRYLNKHNIQIRTKSEVLKGRKVSEETKQKMNESAKNKPPITKETRQKMSISAKNKPPMTEETKQKMSESKKGEKHPRFKSRTKDSNGYISVYSPNNSHKNCDGRVYEHRLVIESQINRPLDPKWVVHYINGIRDDNRSENLICFASESAHQRFHHDPNNVKPEEIIFDGRKSNVD